MAGKDRIGTEWAPAKFLQHDVSVGKARCPRWVNPGISEYMQKHTQGKLHHPLYHPGAHPVTMKTFIISQLTEHPKRTTSR